MVYEHDDEPEPAIPWYKDPYADWPWWAVVVFAILVTSAIIYGLYLLGIYP